MIIILGCHKSLRKIVTTDLFKIQYVSNEGGAINMIENKYLFVISIIIVSVIIAIVIGFTLYYSSSDKPIKPVDKVQPDIKNQTGKLHMPVVIGRDEITKVSPAVVVRQPLTISDKLSEIEKEYRKRFKFSETFLKAFPNIYQDLARLDTQGKFNLLLQITDLYHQFQPLDPELLSMMSMIPNSSISVYAPVTKKDIANLISAVMSESEDGKDLTSEQKRIILNICAGTYEEPIIVRGNAGGTESEMDWHHPVMSMANYGHQPIPETTPYVIKLLKDSDGDVRKAAADALGGSLNVTEAIPQLMELLKDSDRGVRCSAAKTIGDLKATEAIPQLVELLKDNDAGVRCYAVGALVRLGVKEAIPQLMELLKDNDADVRNSATYAMGNLKATEAIPQLVELLKDNDAGVRKAATYALGLLKATEAIPQLMELLKDSDRRIRCSAALTLGNLKATESISQLIELLKDNDADVREAAAYTLGLLKATEAIPQLVELLNDSDWYVRKTAADALDQLKATETIPQLVELLKDSNSEVRGWAGITMVELGAKERVPEGVVADIKCMSKFESYTSRARAALKALGVDVDEE
jgi:HEAT repeat protein